MTAPTQHASAAAATAATATLTASEQLLLTASTARPNADGSPGLRHPENAQLHEAVVAAILANEQAGHVVLEPGTRAKWFGLKKVPTVYVRPAPGASDDAWPAATLERHVLAAARALVANGKHDAGAVTETVVPSSTAPEFDVTEMAWTGLRGRGITERVTTEKTTLKVFKSKQQHEALTAEGAALLARTGASAARQLVDGAARARGDLFQLLSQEVRAAFARRTQSESSSSDNDWSSSD